VAILKEKMTFFPVFIVLTVLFGKWKTFGTSAHVKLKATPGIDRTTAFMVTNWPEARTRRIASQISTDSLNETKHHTYDGVQ